MSLLLDALKKAAEEKKRSDVSSQNSTSKTSTTAEVAVVDSLELELDNSVISETADLPENSTTAILQHSKEFPLVNKNTKSSTPSKNITSEKIKNTTKIMSSTHDKKNKDNDILNIDKNTPDTEKEITDQKPTYKKPTSVTPNKSEASPGTPSAKPIHNASAKKTFHSQHKQLESSNNTSIEREKILSELINNSNQYNKNERFKRNISIAVLIVLIIIGCGLYFFIEIQTTNQNIYLPQDTLINNPSPSTTEKLSAVDNEPKTSSPPTSIPEKQKQSTDTFHNAEEPHSTQTVSVTKKPSEAVKFVRTVRSDPVHKLLMQAYNAFYNQQYKQSETLYKDVLSQEKNNRDALLGLAANAIKQNRFEYARQKYRQLLKLNPRDSLAIAGLSSIEKQTNLQLSESKLKFMIKNNPESAHLYFALGSLYARQKKWPDAQSAYFSAWSTSSENADYAFNLAISLDHLDKKKQALQFYQHCLKLKQSSHANFSPTDVEKRIATLLKSIK